LAKVILIRNPNNSRPSLSFSDFDVNALLGAETLYQVVFWVPVVLQNNLPYLWILSFLITASLRLSA
jgi:hypothetical protein